jgi:hypothetical protein
MITRQSTYTYKTTRNHNETISTKATQISQEIIIEEVTHRGDERKKTP